MMMPTSDFFNKFIKFHFHMVVLDIFGSAFLLSTVLNTFASTFVLNSVLNTL